MKTREGRRRLGLMTSLVASVVCALASPGEAAAPSRYELSFHLEAELRSPRLDAELLAGGRMLMASRRSSDGALTLTLERVLEAPWKLYHVDPAGPFGEETKLAAVITLPVASWEALGERRQAIAHFAEERHAEWTAGARRQPRLDGAFAFVVIGPAAGRFSLTTAASGRVLAVVNRLTDNWLTGPFDRFIGGWGAGELVGRLPLGYWFWNQGEAEPFEYEPHTYHALAAAAGLLDLPVPAPGASADWSTAGVVAREVVETLAPRTAGYFGDRPCGEASARREETEEGLALIESAALVEGCSVDRATVLRSDGGGVLSDRIQTIVTSRGRRLVVRIGYRPVADDG